MNSFDDLNSNNNDDPLAIIEGQINSSKVHIRIQKRNARKFICTVEGLEYEKKDMKDILKTMKKKFACNGNIVNDDKLGIVIQLQGDMRDKIKTLLIEEYNISNEDIVTHGYD